MARDIHNNLHVRRGISPAAAVLDNTPFVSQIADLLGYEAAEFVVLTGALADWNPQARRAVLLREVQGVSCPRIFGHRFVQPETFMMKSSMNQIETNDVNDDPERLTEKEVG